MLDCQLMEGHIVHFVLALTSAVDDASSKRNHESNYSLFIYYNAISDALIITAINEFQNPPTMVALL